MTAVRQFQVTFDCADPERVARFRLLPLGATRLRLLVADGLSESCLVMADVEGNEFCLD